MLFIYVYFYQIQIFPGILNQRLIKSASSLLDEYFIKKPVNVMAQYETCLEQTLNDVNSSQSLL